MCIRDKKSYYLLGGAQEAMVHFELENIIFVKRAEALKLPGKILARKTDNFFIGKNEDYRLLPGHMISSTSMLLWANKTAVFVWSDPYYVILITSDEITKNNIATFNYLWGIAEKPTQVDIASRLLK